MAGTVMFPSTTHLLALMATTRTSEAVAKALSVPGTTFSRRNSDANEEEPLDGGPNNGDLRRNY